MSCFAQEYDLQKHILTENMVFFCLEWAKKISEIHALYITMQLPRIKKIEAFELLTYNL